MRLIVAVLLVLFAPAATPAEDTVSVPRAELERLQVHLAVLTETVEKQRATLRQMADLALACTAQFRPFRDDES